jgi:hypothetical protein
MSATTAAPIICFALDISGSTQNADHYYEIAKREFRAIVDAAKGQGGEGAGTVIAMPWNTGAASVGFDWMARYLASPRPSGGTDPRAIVRKLAELLGGSRGSDVRLVLVTDGQVSPDVVRSLDELLTRAISDTFASLGVPSARIATLAGLPSSDTAWRFTSARCLIINTGSAPNMSVILPFVRGIEHEVQVFDRRGKVVESYSMGSGDLGIIERVPSIQSIEELESVLVPLERAVTIRTMGTSGDAEMREQLIALRSRLSAQIRETTTAANASKVEALAESLRIGLGGGTGAITHPSLQTVRDLALDYYRSMVGNEGESEATPWLRSLSRMIQATTGRLLTRFDTSIMTRTADRMREEVARVDLQALTRAVTQMGGSGGDGGDAAAGVEATGEEAAEEEGDGFFECPISLSADEPVILAASGPPLLSSLPPSDVTRLVTCPLFAVCVPKLREALVSCLDHPIGVTALKEISEGSGSLSSSRCRSPLTRREVIRGGGICLGATEDHIAATDWTIAALLNRGKRTGSPDLWLMVIWDLIKTEPRLEYLTPLLPKLEAQLRVRAGAKTGSASHHLSLSLSTNPELLGVRGPIQLGLWVVEHWPLIAYRPLSDPIHQRLPELSTQMDLLKLPNVDITRAHSAYLWFVFRLIDMLREGGEDGGRPTVIAADGTEMHLQPIPRFPSHPLARLNAARVAAKLMLLGWVKKEPVRMRSCVSALVRKSVQVGSLWLPVESLPGEVTDPAEVLGEGGAHRGLSEALREMRNDGLLMAALALDISPQHSAKDVSLRALWDEADLERERQGVRDALRLSAPLRFPLQSTLERPYKVEICAATCRPYLRDRATGKFWWERAAEILPETPYLSSAARFGDFVVSRGRYPTRDELALYVYERFVNPGKHWENMGIAAATHPSATLLATIRGEGAAAMGAAVSTTPSLPPRRFALEIDVCLAEFAEIAVSVPPEEFARRFTAAVTRDDRERLEG